MSEEEMLSCPFCGRPYKKSEESVVWLETDYCATYYCLCGCEKIGSGSTKSKAIDSLRNNWNRRPVTIYAPRKTCAMEYGETYKVKECNVWFCSECGSPIYNDMKPYYCLYCGCKVER